MKVKFLPQDISVDIKPGKSVMETAREHKLPVSSSCNGMSTCAECRVYIVKGEAHVLPPSAKEVELIGGGYFLDNRRLSCQLFCFGDVTVDLSGQIEREKQGGVMKKQFLKQLDKKSADETSSIGGILVEQDQDMKKVEVSDDRTQDPTEFEEDNFYKKDKGREQQRSSKVGNTKKWNRGSRNRSQNRKSHKRWSVKKNFSKK